MPASALITTTTTSTSLPAPAAPSSPLARLRAQVASYRFIVRYVCLINEQAVRFVDTRLTGEVVPPDAGRWHRVVGALGLSTAQLADAAALYGCWQVGGWACREWVGERGRRGIYRRLQFSQ